MAVGDDVLSVLPAIIGNAPRIVSLTHSGGIHMPGRNPCPPGCECGLHKGGGGRLCPAGCMCGRHGGRSKRTAEDKRIQNRDNQRDRRERLPNENAEIVARWRANHPEEARERQRGAKGIQYMLNYKYGMTPEDRSRRIAEQDGRCYLCREPLDLDDPRKIHVDHDHSCCRGIKSCGNCVRGLACEPCNKGIGMFGDDPERMMRVAERLAAANAEVAARRAAAPVQAELFVINEAASRRKEVS